MLLSKINYCYEHSCCSMIVWKNRGKYMLKKTLVVITLFFTAVCTFAADLTQESNQNTASAEITTDEQVEQERSIQSKINDIGAKILNANKIQDRIVFLYDTRAEKSLLEIDSTVTRRQVVLYNDFYKFTQNDDEIAGLLARGIVTAQRSYMGAINGYSGAVKIKAAPKKFEVVADKIAVDYMVKAGFNPLGLITVIHKSCPQKRFDRFSNKNLTSKRLAVIYEYIYTKYPYFLANNTYINNEHYQNFLLTSIYNRKLLQEKIKTGSKEELDYE